ncbi:MAG: phosphoglucosamine mutase [Endomicrobiia bacterium]
MNNGSLIKNQKLFGTDGIRGVAGEFPLNREFIKKIALCASVVLNKYFPTNKIFIGWDTRESSLWISNLLLKTFQSTGYEVYSLGIFPTPGVAFLCKKHSAIGVVVSASHNSYEFNGIKFFNNFGVKLEDEYEEEIEQTILTQQQIKVVNKKFNIINFYPQAEKEYVEFLTQIFKNGNIKDTIEKVSDLSLTIDCANGSTYRVAQKVFKSLFPKTKFININPNGKNINKNCGSLHPEIVSQKINNNIGFSFDGDGDRVIFVDENKVVRDGDYILGILAAEYKKKKMLSNSFVVPTIMSNLGLLKYLWSKGIKTILAPVGDKNVYEYMKKYKSILGGEQSGHIILWKYLNTGDGMLTALEMLRVILENKKRLADMCKIFNKYPQVIKNIKVEEKLPLEQFFSAKMIKQYEKKVGGRIFIRYSGTEPLLRIMVEGKSKTKVCHITKLLEKHYYKTLKGFKK